MRYRAVTKRRAWGFLVASIGLGAIGCSSDAEKASSATSALDPATAPAVQVDRFSDQAGMLQVRSKSPSLPAAGAPVDFDSGPFITTGLGPDGGSVRYYNFDVQSTKPAPIYALFREGESAPVAGQLNVVDVIPGQSGYNDFWQVMKVTVPADYVANTLTSVAEIQTASYPVESTDSLVNCPVVPAGSTAKLRLGGTSPGLTRGWYRDQVVYYFNFDERSLVGTEVPVAPIFVTFNINPNLDGGGPPSGFKMESGSPQTHNVLSALPNNNGYSPLWGVSPYDNADFATVTDLATVMHADVLANDVANVNCPVVDVGH